VFLFGRVVMISQADATHECRPYLRTREQAASLIRLGAASMAIKSARGKAGAV